MGGGGGGGRGRGRYKSNIGLNVCYMYCFSQLFSNTVAAIPRIKLQQGFNYRKFNLAAHVSERSLNE